MTQRIKSLSRGLAVAMIVAAAAPMAAHAGSVTINNHDCKSLKFDPWPTIIKRVTVHVYDYPDECTDTRVTVGIGDWKTVTLAESHTINGEIYDCNYYHEAEGTAGGIDDVNGSSHSSVTCREDWFDVCQCTKD